jgi:hypothetical protein
MIYPSGMIYRWRGMISPGGDDIRPKGVFIWLRHINLYHFPFAVLHDAIRSRLIFPQSFSAL